MRGGTRVRFAEQKMHARGEAKQHMNTKGFICVLNKREKHTTRKTIRLQEYYARSGIGPISKISEQQR